MVWRRQHYQVLQRFALHSYRGLQTVDRHTILFPIDVVNSNGSSNSFVSHTGGGGGIFGTFCTRKNEFQTRKPRRTKVSISVKRKALYLEIPIFDDITTVYLARFALGNSVIALILF